MADVYDPLLFESTIDVVVLEARTGRTVPVAGHIPVDLDDDAEPVGELLTELLAATVHVRADEGIHPDVLAALRDVPVPPAFHVSPWLDASRAIVVRDGLGRVGELTVRYRDGGGLRIDAPDAQSETDSADPEEHGSR